MEPSDSPPGLRVCADPNNLPFSNRQQQGFETQIAELLARARGGRLSGPFGPGVVIRRAMQGPALAVGRHSRHSGVRFMGRCHCYRSLTLVRSAGRGTA